MAPTIVKLMEIAVKLREMLAGIGCSNGVNLCATRPSNGNIHTAEGGAKHQPILTYTHVVHKYMHIYIPARVNVSVADIQTQKS